MKKCVWLFGCLPEAASNTLTTVILPDMPPLKTALFPPFLNVLLSTNVQKLLGSADRHPNSLSVSHPSSAPCSATSDSVVLGHFQLTIFTGDTADKNKAGQHASSFPMAQKEKKKNVRAPTAGLCTSLKMELTLSLIVTRCFNFIQNINLLFGSCKNAHWNACEPKYKLNRKKTKARHLCDNTVLTETELNIVSRVVSLEQH